MKVEKYRVGYRNGTGDLEWPEVDGKQVTIPGFEQIKLFVCHMVEPGHEKEWCVCEVSTGAAVSYKCGTRAAAIKKATELLNAKGLAKAKKIIREYKKNFPNYLPPKQAKERRK